MSHEIEITQNGPAIAYAGEVPWHGLGTRVPKDLTPQQMLRAAQLDWEVEKVPGYFKKDGSEVLMPRSVLLRSSDGAILDTVPNEWNPLQNEEAFQFFQDFVMAGDMEMHTAGSLKGGRIVWALAKINESFQVTTSRDVVESHLLFTNPHQFGKAIDVRFTPIRVVCHNTLSMALSQSQQVVKTSHRVVFDPERVKLTLGVAHHLLDQYKLAAQFIATRRWTSDTLSQYFDFVFPSSSEEKSKKYELAHEVMDRQPGAEMSAGTWWQAFNAVTYITDHLHGRKQDTRLESAWFGTNRALKSLALNKAVEMADASPGA